MSEKYEQEQKELGQRILQLKQEFDEAKKQTDASDRFINIVKKYTYLNELDANILNELIDRIVVHHKEKDQSGRTYQQIEIYYRFIGSRQSVYVIISFGKIRKKLMQKRSYHAGRPLFIVNMPYADFYALLILLKIINFQNLC